MEAMAEEATSAEKSALAVLREAEEKATSEELSRVAANLERERTEAEVELKRQLHVSDDSCREEAPRQPYSHYIRLLPDESRIQFRLVCSLEPARLSLYVIAIGTD